MWYSDMLRPAYKIMVFGDTLPSDHQQPAYQLYYMYVSSARGITSRNANITSQTLNKQCLIKVSRSVFRGFLCNWLVFSHSLCLMSVVVFCASRRMFVQTKAVMMTSSNGNIFRVTGPLCGEFIGPGEFPTQRPVPRSFDVFFICIQIDRPLSHD